MKKILFVVIGILTTINFSFSQEIPDYFTVNSNSTTTRNAIRLAPSQNLGTARFQSLSGAMGALGSDFGALKINPAGVTLASSLSFSSTLGLQINRNKATFGGNSDLGSSGTPRINQVGFGININANEKKDSATVKRIGFAFNYQVVQEFDNEVSIPTNENLIVSRNFGINGNDTLSLQNLTETSEGFHSISTASVGINLNNKLSFGLNLNFHRVEFNELIQLTGVNQNGETANFTKRKSPNDLIGNGFSLDVGAIWEANQNLRLGLSYGSPAWFSEFDLLFRDFNNFDTRSNIFFEDQNLQELYKYTGSNKFTGSIAYINGRFGFVSLDATYNLRSSTKLREFNNTSDFTLSNNYLDDVLADNLELRLGSEFLIKNYRLRIGGSYTESPFNEVTLTAGDLNQRVQYKPLSEKFGLSAGLGWVFNEGQSRIDIGYSFSKQDAQYLLDRSPVDNVDYAPPSFNDSVYFFENNGAVFTDIREISIIDYTLTQHFFSVTYSYNF